MSLDEFGTNAGFEPLDPPGIKARHDDHSLLPSFEEPLSKQEILDCILENEAFLKSPNLFPLGFATPRPVIEAKGAEAFGSGSKASLDLKAEMELSERLSIDTDLANILSKYLPDRSTAVDEMATSTKSNICALSELLSVIDKSEASSSTKPCMAWPSNNEVVSLDAQVSMNIYLEHVQNGAFSSLLGEPCKLCGPQRLFHRRHDLLTHIRNSHLHHRPFRCDKCQARFKRKSHLEGHQRSVHQGARLYKCKHCEKSYSSDSSRRKHCRDIHQTEDY